MYKGSTSSYLDCDNILRCGDGREQEVMKCSNDNRQHDEYS